MENIESDIVIVSTTLNILAKDESEEIYTKEYFFQVLLKNFLTIFLSLELTMRQALKRQYTGCSESAGTPK